MSRPPCAGPRQTVERVLHPNRGEGFAVYDHGPSVFVPDGGEPIAMRIRLGGANREYSWRCATDPNHGEVQLRVLAHGERHDRMWSEGLGAGWLVWETASKPARIRFEADDGAVLRVAWNRVTVGTPGYVRRFNKARSKSPEMTEEERHWRTFEGTDGSTWAFRDAPPDPAPARDEPVNEKQGALFGGAS